MEEIILFYKYNFHLSGLQPISNELNKLGINHTLTGKRHLVYDEYERTKKKFKLIVLADEWNLFEDCAEEVMTISHSMAGKNTTFNNKNSDMDYLCVQSPFYKSEYLKRGVFPKKEIFITGFSPADKIFNKQWDTESWWCLDALKKEITQVNILFAPTYNRDLSLIDELIRAEKENSFFKELFSNSMIKYKVAFKGHPVINKKYPQQIEEIKKIRFKYPDQFYLHEEFHSDIADAVLWADFCIGDCSGAILLALAKGIPIFAYDHPNRERSPYYDLKGPEWNLRNDFAYTFDSFNQLSLLLEESYKFDSKKTTRMEIKNLVYGEHQGNAAFNIAKVISHLV